MQFRYARHTNDLKPLIRFYKEVIGFEELGRFDDHASYNGIMLGFPGESWHLELTESDNNVRHNPDADDLLVFYLHSRDELNAIRKDAEAFGSELPRSKNPYWRMNGLEITDPDDYGVMLTIQPRELHADAPATRAATSMHLRTWDELLQHVRHLPYGRNTSRTRFEQVLQEGKGSCSTKHALLKTIALENGFNEVKLILALYHLTEKNTPGIGKVLSQAGLQFIPEAHCYLKINGKRIDLTNPRSDFRNLKADLLEETEIAPEQVGDFKVKYHQAFMARWKDEQRINKSFDELWAIREACIAALSEEVPTPKSGSVAQ